MIQPFDGATFDKRFRDLYAPAISAAGADPYRVDADSTVDVPIQEIEKRVGTADLVFCDISMDNPNVWFELGLAKSAGKALAIVCETSRRPSLPFDVRHLSVIFYDTSSPSDFHDLFEKLTARVKALVVREENSTKTDPSPNQNNPSSGKGSELEGIDLAALSSIVAQATGVYHRVYSNTIISEMKDREYNELATFMAISSLENRGLITVESGESYNEYFGGSHEWERYTLTARGWSLLLGKKKELNLTNFGRPGPF